MEALAIDKYALFWHRNVFGRLSFSSQGPVAGLVLPAVLGLRGCGLEALVDLRAVKAAGIVLGGDHLAVISIGVGRPVEAARRHGGWESARTRSTAGTGRKKQQRRTREKKRGWKCRERSC